MNSNAINQLLRFYELETHGSLDARRLRLAEYANIQTPW